MYCREVVVFVYVHVGVVAYFGVTFDIKNALWMTVRVTLVPAIYGSVTSSLLLFVHSSYITRSCM